MEASQVEGILKVHREGGTLSAEAILDEGIREVGAMEQVSCCDPNERADQAQRFGCLAGKLWVDFVARWRNAGLLVVVIY